MNMLNPTAIKNPKDYGPDDIDGLFIRRFKKDVKDQIAGNFPERVVLTPRGPATAAEEAAYQHLASLRFTSLALKLKENQISILHGGLSDIEQQDAVEAFGSADSPVRLMIASDVASEGINLHHQSHRLIHFDIPWSLLTFQQRNGRVERYGQVHQPAIYYLLTDSSHEKIRGDQRILELLIERDAEVQKNIGDPSEFTGLHTVEDEELAVAAAIESDAPPEQALAETFAATSAADDWFNAFLNAQPPPTPVTPAKSAPPSSNSISSNPSPRASPPPTTTSARKRKPINAPSSANTTTTKPGSPKLWKPRTHPPSASLPSSETSIPDPLNSPCSKPKTSVSLETPSPMCAGKIKNGRGASFFAYISTS